MLLPKLLTNTYSVGSTVDVHVWNGMTLQDLVSISDARRCTCHRHRGRPATMMDSCPHHDTDTTNTVDLTHNAPSYLYRQACVHRQVTGELKPVLHLAHVHHHLCWHTADVSLSKVGSKPCVTQVCCGGSISEMTHSVVSILSSGGCSVTTWPRPAINTLSGDVPCP